MTEDAKDLGGGAPPPNPVLTLLYVTKGGVEGNAAIAARVAELILEPLIGAAKLKAHLPLRVEDQGECWLVRGSYNVDRAVEGPGQFSLKVQKRDARVLEVQCVWVMHTPPEVQELLREERAKKPPQRT